VISIFFDQIDCS